MRVFLVIGLCLIASSVFSQRDRKDTLSFEQYLQIVKEHHPFMERAGLLPMQAEANLMMARGGFDPKVFADISQKYFDGDQYYSVISSGVSIPTWFGLNFYSGFDQTGGVNLNPQFKMPDAGLVYAGAQWTLGQGLFIDQRRADLKQAKLFTQIAENDRVMLVNQLLLDASLAYWDWYAAHNSYAFIDEAYGVTRVRFEAIRQAAFLGERAFIDTLEISIQLQNLDLLRQDFKLQELNRRLECGVFLWADGTVPVELNDNVAPSRNTDSKYSDDLNSIALQVRSLVDNHPEIMRDLMRIDQQQIDLRLKREMLKPIANLKYNALNQPVGNNLIANYSIQNYTWGVDFAIPILLRKERAGVQLSKLRLQDMNLVLDNKRALILMKAQASINEWQIISEQLKLYQKNLRDINRLLDAERSLFENGESSVFLVNTREIVFVNAQVKLYEFIAKSQKAVFKSYYSLALMEGL
mgnify:CR=1 FL=1